jgi:hypothetical protein
MDSEANKVMRFNDFQEATSDGAWVSHADYAKLERAVEVLAKANNKWVDNWQDRYNKNVDGWVIALPEIAAVDENPTAKAAIAKARKEAGNG